MLIMSKRNSFQVAIVLQMYVYGDGPSRFDDILPLTSSLIKAMKQDAKIKVPFEDTMQTKMMLRNVFRCKCRRLSQLTLVITE